MSPHPIRCAKILLLLATVCRLANPQSESVAASPSQAPVSYSSVSQLNAILSLLEQAAQTSQVDLAKLRIERWKTDSSFKRQAQANADSVAHNLQAALPEIISQLRASPEDLSATFKLYRNLEALYDVFGSVVEGAGAFGTRDDYQSLANDLNAVDKARRSLAERMESLAASKEAELSHLRTELKNLQATANPQPPPKKIVVDDNEPPKKPVRKKAAPKPSSPSPATPPPSQPQPPSQAQPH